MKALLLSLLTAILLINPPRHKKPRMKAKAAWLCRAWFRCVPT